MIRVLREGANRLMERDGTFLCADTRTIRNYYQKALSGFHGRVLVTGLGLGVALEYLCSQERVKSVDCVEIDAEVVLTYANSSPKARILHADAWQHRGSYDCCFHDIWSDYVGKKQEAERLQAQFDAPLQVSLPLTYDSILSRS